MQLNKTMPERKEKNKRRLDNKSEFDILDKAMLSGIVGKSIFPAVSGDNRKRDFLHSFSNYLGAKLYFLLCH